AGPWFFGHPFLELLVVRESSRRRGVGRALVRAVEARFAGAKLFTSTNQSNAPMQRLLASLGYTPSGVIHNLDPGDPELVFVRLGSRRLSACARRPRSTAPRPSRPRRAPRPRSTGSCGRRARAWPP